MSRLRQGASVAGEGQIEFGSSDHSRRAETAFVSPGGPKERALLALLLLHANEPVSRAALIDGLWGERPPETAAKALQVYVRSSAGRSAREVVRAAGRVPARPRRRALDRAASSGSPPGPHRRPGRGRGETARSARPLARAGAGRFRGRAVRAARVGRLEELRLAPTRRSPRPSSHRPPRRARPRTRNLVAHNPSANASAPNSCSPSTGPAARQRPSRLTKLHAPPHRTTRPRAQPNPAGARAGHPAARPGSRLRARSGAPRPEPDSRLFYRRCRSRYRKRKLATVLFADLVGSTRARRAGSGAHRARARPLLRRDGRGDRGAPAERSRSSPAMP